MLYSALSVQLRGRLHSVIGLFLGIPRKKVSRGTPTDPITEPQLFHKGEESKRSPIWTRFSVLHRKRVHLENQANVVQI